MKKVLISLLGLIILGGLLGCYVYSERQAERIVDVKSYVFDSARRHNIRPSLVFALIQKESNFDANARGKHQEYGLMQIRDGAADDWCRAMKNPKFRSYGKLIEPELNVEIGTWYLAKAQRRWKGYKYQDQIALAQYNAGPGRVKEWIPKEKNGEFLPLVKIASTRDYITKILEFEKDYLGLREEDVVK